MHTEAAIVLSLAETNPRQLIERIFDDHKRWAESEKEALHGMHRVVVASPILRPAQRKTNLTRYQAIIESLRPNVEAAQTPEEAIAAFIPHFEALGSNLSELHAHTGTAMYSSRPQTAFKQQIRELEELIQGLANIATQVCELMSLTPAAQSARSAGFST